MVGDTTSLGQDKYSLNYPYHNNIADDSTAVKEKPIMMPLSSAQMAPSSSTSTSTSYERQQEDPASRVCGAILFSKFLKTTKMSSSTLSPSAVGIFGKHNNKHNISDKYVHGSSIATSSFASAPIFFQHPGVVVSGTPSQEPCKTHKTLSKPPKSQKEKAVSQNENPTKEIVETTTTPTTATKARTPTPIPTREEIVARYSPNTPAGMMSPKRTQSGYLSLGKAGCSSVGGDGSSAGLDMSEKSLLLDHLIDSQDVIQFDPSLIQELKAKHGRLLPQEKRRGPRPLPPLSVTDATASTSGFDVPSPAKHSRTHLNMYEMMENSEVGLVTLQSLQSTRAWAKDLQKSLQDEVDTNPSFQFEPWDESFNQHLDHQRSTFWSEQQPSTSLESTKSQEEIITMLKQDRENFQSETSALRREFKVFRQKLEEVKQTATNHPGPWSGEPWHKIDDNSPFLSDSLTYGDLFKSQDSMDAGLHFKKEWELGFVDQTDQEENPVFEGFKNQNDQTPVLSVSSADTPGSHGDHQAIRKSAAKEKSANVRVPVPGKPKEFVFATEKQIQEEVNAKAVSVREAGSSKQSSIHEKDGKIESNGTKHLFNLLSLAQQQGAVLKILHKPTKSDDSRQPFKRQGVTSSVNQRVKLLEDQIRYKKNEVLEAPHSKIKDTNYDASSDGNLKETTTIMMEASNVDQQYELPGRHDVDEDEYTQDMKQVRKLLQKYGGNTSMIDKQKQPRTYQEMEAFFGQHLDGEQPVVQIENMDAVSEYNSVYSDTGDPDFGFLRHAELYQKGERSISSAKKPRKYKLVDGSTPRSTSSTRLISSTHKISDRVRFKESIQSRVIVGDVHYDNEICPSRAPSRDPDAQPEDRQDQSSSPRSEVSKRDPAQAASVLPPPRKEHKVGSLIQYWEVRG